MVGTIKMEHFKQILEESLALPQEECFQLLAMAEDIAMIEKKDSYGYEHEVVMSYSYFCMQFEKLLLMRKTTRKKTF